MPHLCCSFTDCGRPVFVKKTLLGPLCNGHYKQLKQLLKKGVKVVDLKLTPLRKYTPRVRATTNWERTCLGPGAKMDATCGRPCWGSHDYCQSHQRQIWDGKKPAALEPIRHYDFQIDKQCNEDGCEDPAKARGKCARHYSQYRNRLRKQRKEQTSGQDQREASAAAHA